MRSIFPLLLTAALAHGADEAVLACGTHHGEVVKLRGDIDEPGQLSGVAATGPFLVVVSDEVKHPTRVPVLKKNGAAYEVTGRVELPAGDEEVDLEAVAVDGAEVYVTGSHAATRKVRNGQPEEPRRRQSREQVFRFRLDVDGKAAQVEGPRSLSPAIAADPVLGRFVGIAAKENGIDIEGLAVQDGHLHFGFRGPVLRNGLVPVLTTRWDDLTGDAQVRYVRLDGRGIRDMAAVEGGFLILAGPVGDGDGSYRLYFWDGVDQSTDSDAARPQRLAEFAAGTGKPEGLAVLGAHDGDYDLLLLCDGLPQGGLARLRIRRP
ncbi:MAG TPA: DUF3616 domain-containing protein [Burkholderiales bacterium]|nr:DUF3616 domain-containing protein [Burkholderiales bacterium]